MACFQGHNSKTHVPEDTLHLIIHGIKHASEALEALQQTSASSLRDTHIFMENGADEACDPYGPAGRVRAMTCRRLRSFHMEGGFSSDWNRRDVEALQFLRQLYLLRTLRLRHVHHLTGIPSLAQCRSLQVLDLSDCRHLKEIPSLTTLTALQTLDLHGCEHLHELPQLASGIRSIDLSGCTILPSLPDSMRQLQLLERLVLSHCSDLHRLPSGISKLTKLQELHLQGCHALTGLADLKVKGHRCDAVHILM
jgi:hypothetical protein